MNNENKETQAALREIAAEMRRTRQVIMIGFAVIFLIAGLLMFYYPDYYVPMVVCFAVAAGFAFWGAFVRFGRAFNKFAHALREEARLQRDLALAAEKRRDDIRPS